MFKIIQLSLISFLLFCSTLSFGQDTTSRFNYALTLNEGLSHSGINSGITFNVRYKNHEIYAGPVMALSDSYFRNDPRMGYNFGVRFYTSNAHKFNSYVFVDYQRIYYRPFLRELFNTHVFNTTSEFVVGMGQEWRLVNNVFLSGAMAYGKYFEKFHDLPEDKVVHFNDGTIQLRFGVTYKFR